MSAARASSLTNSRSPAAFIRAMQEFKSGARQATLMGHVAKGYTDEEIKAMAEFFAKVKP